MELFTPIRTLWVVLADGAKLFFREPSVSDIKSELGFASMPPATKSIAKETLYLEMFDRVEPETSIYAPGVSSSNLTKEIFTLTLMQAMIAPPPITLETTEPTDSIEYFVNTTWKLGDKDLDSKGKSIWVKIPNSISIVKLTSQIEGAAPEKFIEVISGLFLADTSPEMTEAITVREFEKRNGTLLGIYYQQMISIASDFFRRFPKVDRRF